MYSHRLEQRSWRLAHLAVAVALSMALVGVATADQQAGRHAGAVGLTGAVGRGSRNLLWDQPEKEPEPEPEPIKPVPVYAENNKFRGPETPKFAYTTAPTPATYDQSLKVRSEKPWVDIYNREKDWVNAKGSTKVDTWEGAKLDYRAQTGKGSELKFNSGKRAFQVERKSRVDVNFPQTAVVVAGGDTLNVDQKVEVYGAGANETIAFATGNGPTYANNWAVNAGPTNTIGHGAGRRLLSQATRDLLWGNPAPEPEPEPEPIMPVPVYAENNKFRGPETPKFAYTTAPTPATYDQSLKVRSEKPWVDIYNREKDWVNAKGSTKVDTWEGAKLDYKAQTGKGSELKFNSGKRAFQVERKSRVDVNFPQTAVVVAGGDTLNVDQKVEVYGAGANETIAFATGNGPTYANNWAVNAGSTNTVGHGRRLLSQATRDLLWGNPAPEPEPEPEPIKPVPVYAENNKFRGPETPKFAYTTAPTPATYDQSLKVRSEKPWVDIYNREKDWVNAKGSTKVDTWEGAKLDYRAQTGKGSELKFNSGKRAFQVERKSRVDVNFPQTAVVVAGGDTLNVDQKVEVYGAGANETIAFATGNGPTYANNWAVNAGSTNTVGHGRRRRQ